jgi:hypothetical protein
MPQFDIELNIRDLDGDLVLALENEAGGYWVRRGGMPTGERRWNRQEVTSPWADGAGLIGATLDQNTESLLVKVFGPTWVSVETRYEALKAATSAHVWLLEEHIEGVSRVWRAGPVDALPAPVEPVDILNKRRFVVLTFPVQPTPAITGL